jgi:hypothetical protein
MAASSNSLEIERTHTCNVIALKPSCSEIARSDSVSSAARVFSYRPTSVAEPQSAFSGHAPAEHKIRLRAGGNGTAAMPHHTAARGLLEQLSRSRGREPRLEELACSGGTERLSALDLLDFLRKVGRGERIRTSDPSVPNRRLFEGIARQNEEIEHQHKNSIRPSGMGMTTLCWVWVSRLVRNRRSVRASPPPPSPAIRERACIPASCEHPCAAPVAE